MREEAELALEWINNGIQRGNRKGKNRISDEMCLKYEELDKKDNKYFSSQQWDRKKVRIGINRDCVVLKITHDARDTLKNDKFQSFIV